MTNEHQLLERFFYEARRNAFLVSFFYFIGGIAGLGVLTILDPELGVIILILGCVWMVAITLVFLLLIRRLHQPLAEIKKITDEFFAGIMRDEELEPVGAGAEIEQSKLDELTQQIRGLKKEISVLKKKKVSSAKEQDMFWRDLTLKYAFFGAVLCVAVFIAPNPIDLILAIAGAVGLTAIALIHAHYEGRLKWLSRLRWPSRPKWLGGDE